jgi:hypothetical protein
MPYDRPDGNHAGPLFIADEPMICRAFSGSMNKLSSFRNFMNPITCCRMHRFFVYQP